MSTEKFNKHRSPYHTANCLRSACSQLNLQKAPMLNRADSVAPLVSTSARAIGNVPFGMVRAANKRSGFHVQEAHCTPTLPVLGKFIWVNESFNR